MDLSVNKWTWTTNFPLSKNSHLFFCFVIIKGNHKYRNTGAGTKYPISKNSEEKMKHSLTELHISNKQQAEETFMYHFLVSFCVPSV